MEVLVGFHSNDRSGILNASLLRKAHIDSRDLFVSELEILVNVYLLKFLR